MAARGLLSKHSQLIGLVQRLLDIGTIVVAFFGARLLRGQEFSEPLTLLILFCAVALFLFCANLFGLYRSWRAHSLSEEFQALFFTLIGMVLGLLLLAYVTKTTQQFSRLSFSTWWLLLPGLLMLLRAGVRALLKHYRRRGFNMRRVAIVGSGRAAQELAREIDRNDWMGLRIIGYYDDRQTLREEVADAPKLAICGLFDDLIRAAREHKVDEVYVALPMKAEVIMTRIVTALADCSIPVHIVPDVFTFQLLNSRSSSIGHIPVVSVYESPLDDMGVLLKRSLDLLGSTLILAIVALPMLLIALAIKLDSAGPVLFKQRRYGMRGEAIEVWKFRSMRVLENGGHIPQATKNDPRITRLGAFLRRTSLDELPQFFNVLQGSMSIVGPRPHAVAHNELYRKSIDGYMLRHMVKPGITGWAQINGWRGETDTDEKMIKRIEYDLDYLRNWSLLLDIKIILLTVFKGFVNKNAY